MAIRQAVCQKWLQNIHPARRRYLSVVYPSHVVKGGTNLCNHPSARFTLVKVFRGTSACVILRKRLPITEMKCESTMMAAALKPAVPAGEARNIRTGLLVVSTPSIKMRTAILFARGVKIIRIYIRINDRFAEKRSKDWP